MVLQEVREDPAALLVPQAPLLDELHEIPADTRIQEELVEHDVVQGRGESARDEAR
jgi:hypothetical protein